MNLIQIQKHLWVAAQHIVMFDDWLWKVQLLDGEWWGIEKPYRAAFAARIPILP